MLNINVFNTRIKLWVFNKRYSFLIIIKKYYYLNRFNIKIKLI